jgi:hypothetical protein
LKTKDFDFMLNSVKCSFDDLFPGFHQQDRLGIVVRQAGGSAGASALLMAAVTRFYDFHRANLGKEQDHLQVYPEFFIFHVGKQHLDHYWMDVWTPNKEVIVEDDPEQILEAINDRGITRLLVEDIAPSPATFLPETISSGNLRIKTALAYSPTGRVNDANVSVTSCTAAEQYVFSSFFRSRLLLEDTYEQLQQHRKSLLMNGRTVETYRQTSLKEAFSMLTTSIGPGHTTRHYISMLLEE